ncbi:MAG TPA: NUDIX hydrolase [Xanthobacteraceae bacterium]|jgi:ADP-ribose pyrophosphatase YjhB (NUDIX family)
MRDSTNRPVLAASAACFRDGRLLLVRRANPPQLWTLPGGRVELGERAAEAALRELREEAGVAAEIVGFAGHREMLVRDGGGAVTSHFVILAFAARWREGEAKPSPELAALKWIEPSMLAQFNTTDGLAEIVEIAKRLVAA